jgi:hypothetical protein
MLVEFKAKKGLEIDLGNEQPTAAQCAAGAGGYWLTEKQVGLWTKLLMAKYIQK